MRAEFACIPSVAREEEIETAKSAVKGFISPVRENESGTLL